VNKLSKRRAGITTKSCNRDASYATKSQASQSRILRKRKLSDQTFELMRELRVDRNASGAGRGGKLSTKLKAEADGDAILMGRELRRMTEDLETLHVEGGT